MVYLVFKNARFDFLSSQRTEYEAAVSNGTVGEFLDIVYARYARRFPIEMPLTEDPPREVLDAIDDDAPAPEPEQRCSSEVLTQEERDAEDKRRQDRQALIKKRKKQIATWFSYRHMKEHHPDPRSTDPSNPFTLILFSLTGKSVRERPRQKSAVNCWSKTESANADISAEVRTICITQGIKRNHSVAVWNTVAREKFALLPGEERSHWEQRAKDDHAKELAEWKALNEGKISSKPEDRQRCIEGMISFGQLIIEAMAESTGMKIALYAGGPEPAHDGRLSIISMYAGTNGAEDPLNFGQAERKAIVDGFFPVFSRFLRSSFTPEECRLRSLNEKAGISAIDDTELEAHGGTLDEVAASPAEGGATSSATAPALQSADAAALVTPDPSSIQSPPAAGPALEQNTVSAPVNAAAPALASVAAHATANATTPSSPIASPPISPLHSPRAASPSASGVATLGSPFKSPTRRDGCISNCATPSPPASPTSLVSPARQGDPVPAPAAAEPAAAQDIQGQAPAAESAATAPKVVESDAVESDAIESDIIESDAVKSNAIESSVVKRAAISGKRSSGRKRAGALLDAPQAKRGRGSTGALPAAPIEPTTATATATTTPGASVSPPPTAETLQATHAWFAKAVDMFNDESLGDGWAKLVAAWVAFEVRFKCTPNGSLSSKGRPAAVGEWIARARSSTYRPRIDDSKVFGNMHIDWWTMLQPYWRVVDDGATFLEVDAGDLECLNRPGKNGLLSVLASLFFWGDAVKAAGKKSKRWNVLVADCTRVLEHLTASA